MKLNFKVTKILNIFKTPFFIFSVFIVFSFFVYGIFKKTYNTAIDDIKKNEKIEQSFYKLSILHIFAKNYKETDKYYDMAYAAYNANKGIENYNAKKYSLALRYFKKTQNTKHYNSTKIAKEYIDNCIKQTEIKILILQTDKSETISDAIECLKHAKEYASAISDTSIKTKHLEYINRKISYLNKKKTEIQKEQNNIKNSIGFYEDRIENEIYYYDKKCMNLLLRLGETSTTKTMAICPTIIKRDNTNLLYFRILRRAGGTLKIKKLLINVDKKLIYNNDTTPAVNDQTYYHGSTEESAFASADENSYKDIINSDVALMRFEGEGYADEEITKEEKNALQRMLDYKYFFLEKHAE